MTFEIFMILTLIISVFTGLVTEAAKKILNDVGITKYSLNALAGWIALALSAVIGIGYMVLFDVAFTGKTIVSLSALGIIGWLCATVGYDKVMQAITQIKVYVKKDY